MQLSQLSKICAKLRFDSFDDLPKEVLRVQTFGPFRSLPEFAQRDDALGCGGVGHTRELCKRSDSRRRSVTLNRLGPLTVTETVTAAPRRVRGSHYSCTAAPASHSLLAEGTYVSSLSGAQHPIGDHTEAKTQRPDHIEHTATGRAQKSAPHPARTAGTGQGQRSRAGFSGHTQTSRPWGAATPHAHEPRNASPRMCRYPSPQSCHRRPVPASANSGPGGERRGGDAAGGHARACATAPRYCGLPSRGRN